MSDSSLFLPERLKEFIDGAGLSFRESGQSYIFDCPQCGERNKLYIRKTDGQTTCFKCKGKDVDPGGRPEFVLSTLTGLPLGEVSKRLYRWMPKASTFGKIDIPGLELEAEDSDGETFTTGAEPVPSFDLPSNSYPLDDDFHAKRGADYLEGRGVPRGIAMEYGIRYWTPKRRVVFPIAMHGVNVGYQTRMIDPVKPYVVEKEGKQKIITPLKSITYPEALPKDRVVMFHHRMVGSPHAIFHEGPVSSLKAHLCGGNVATMGKAVSAAQIDLVRQAGCKRLYWGLDTDAVETTARLVRSCGLEEMYHLPVPAGFGDHGEMAMEDVLDIFHGAQRVFSTNVFISLR